MQTPEAMISEKTRTFCAFLNAQLNAEAKTITPQQIRKTEKTVSKLAEKLRARARAEQRKKAELFRIQREIEAAAPNIPGALLAARKETAEAVQRATGRHERAMVAYYEANDTLRYQRELYARRMQAEEYAAAAVP